MNKIQIKIKKILKCLLITLIIFIYFVLFFFILFYFGLLGDILKINFDKNKLTFASTQISMYDDDNNSLKLKNTLSKTITYNEIPQNVIDSFVSIEDKDFFKHKGINYKRIVKASLKNIESMKFKEGASTISQQLIKNTHLTSEKTINRKIKEMLITQKLERSLSKNEILTSYLNAIYFGSGTFGINCASQRFFSKDVSKLNLIESATLAGIIKSPKNYSPITNPERCLIRRNLVLSEMYKDKKISKEDYEKSIKENLNLNINNNFLGNNDYYSNAVAEACEILHIPEKDFLLKGYKIYTYQDYNLQNVVENEINNYKKYTNNVDCDSLTFILDNKTGGVKAFSGKSEYNLLSLNRQPGSTLKPIISYAPAIENNIISPSSLILDEKYSTDNYSPSNYKEKYYEWISAKTALSKSLNIPSIKILEYTGIENCKNFAQNLGIKFDKNDVGPSLALGGMTKGVSFLDLASCYQSFANYGKQIKPSFVKEIKTKDGKTIYKNPQIEKQKMKTSTAFLISDMLKESVNNGTSKRLKNEDFEICAKTGTVGVKNSKQNENSDIWNISYTPQYTVCSWFGSTNDKYLNKSLTGATGPSMLSQSIYNSLNKPSTKEEKIFKVPESVIKCELNELEYNKNKKILLCDSKTPRRYVFNAYFSQDNIPTETSKMFKEIEQIKLDLVDTKENIIKLSFNANKYLIYNLIQETNEGKKIIKEIKNKEGQIDILDNIITGKIYTYYLTAKYLYNIDDNNKEERKSNEIKIVLSKKSPNYIHNLGAFNI